MKTLIFKIDISENDKKLIKSLQNDYSISFRKLFNNIELMRDNEYLKTLKIKSKKQIEYIQKEVEAFYKRNQKNKENILNNINKLLFIEKLNLKQFKHLQYLKKAYNKNICFGNKKELIKISKGNGNINVWKESRLLPLVFYGETSRNGNRFFNLKEISNGKILFKLESTNIKIPISFNIKKHVKELIRLEELAILKNIAITIKLTSDLIFITFDESILNGTNIDIKKFYKEISEVKNKETRKILIRNKYIDHENKLKEDKLDRYLAIDLNPDGIGYCILDKISKLITKGYIDISKIFNANKRKYETSIMVKELFKLIKHYRCHTIIVEELNLNIDNLGNRVSNRKVNNLWNRNLIVQIITRRCNEEGILKIDINPAYTSFIGNVMYKEYDPIAASMEVGRRGINKYIKGGFYPELDFTNYINDLRYDKIKGCLTWKDMYSLFITSKWSYRRKLIDFSFVGYYIGNRKSCLKRLHFQ